MKKPIILITPQRMPMEAPYQGEYHYSNSFNSDAVLDAGGIPVIPAFLTEENAEILMERADGLLMSGGADVEPELYGEEKLPACGKTEPKRDQSDLALLKAALKLHKPVLCICRGSQLANAYFGGTLYQDLPSQFGGSINHSGDQTYAQVVHGVRVEQDTPLHRALGCDRLEINSLHHQAVRNLAPRLREMAHADDGIVESWYLPEHGQWLQGYQWHPELLQDKTQCRAIFGAFLKACRDDK